MNIEGLEHTIQRVIGSGPFAATWESLKGYTVPAWYEDGKFGIFIHWGLYAVPAFDNEWYPRNMYLKDSAAYKHHLETYGPQTTFGYKDFLPLFIERGQLSEILPRFWQSDTSILRNSWCHVASPDYKTVPELIGDLMDIVSKNGTLLLNIGPHAGGTIPEQDAEMLRSIGRWLAVNGEAIYASRPWKVFGEGPTQIASGSFTDAKKLDFTSQDIRFTTRGETLYATFLAWPENGSVVITSLAENTGLYPSPIAKVELLGADKPLSWERDAAGLRVELPVDKPCDHAGVLKITA